MMITKKVGFPSTQKPAPAPMAEAPEMPMEGETETEETPLYESVKSALETGMAGVTDPKEAATILRDLADMIEGGEALPAEPTEE
jgi:hypothetical protein